MRWGGLRLGRRRFLGAIVIGSSGIDDKRFLEIVVQSGSATERFGLVSGSPVC